MTAPEARVTRPPEWFEQWFGEEYLALYPHRDEREAGQAVRLVESRLQGAPVSRALDLACGSGRHAKVLGDRWWTVGLDLSETLLRIARQADPAASYVRGDMRELPFADQTFDLVVNLFTSFGYFENDAQHLRVLAEVARVTKRGGTFVLDFLNAGQTRRSLVASETRMLGDTEVRVRREISADNRFVVKTITHPKDEQERSFLERVRLFDRDDLETMLEEAGFGVREVLGDYTGAALGADSPRAIFFVVRE